MTLDQLYHRYTSDPTKLDNLLSRVTDYSTSIARNIRHTDPEDIGQRVTIKVWKQWKKYTGKGSFAGWVSRMTRNMMLDDFRASDPVDQPSEASEEEQTTTTYLDSQDRDFTALPEEMHRIAAMLRMGYTRQEVADKIGCSVRTLERVVDRYATSLEAA